MTRPTHKCLAAILVCALSVLASALMLPAQTVKLKVSAEQANIRLKPDIGAALVRQVPQGTILESDGKEGEWFLVRLVSDDGKPLAGYVHESLVVLLQPRVPAEPPTKETPEPLQQPPPDLRPQPRIQSPQAQASRSEPASPLRPFAFEISGGVVYLAGGDPNKAVRGTADYYQARLGILYNGRVGSAHLGPSAGFSLDYWIRPRVGIGVAAEIIYAGDEIVLSYRGGANDARLDIVPELSSIPIRIHLVLAPAPAFVVKTGLEFYFARCRYLYRFSSTGTSAEWKGDARAHGLGFYASVSWERPIFGPVAVIVEASGRFARVSGFEGKNVFKAPDGSTAGEEGILYFYTGKIAEGDSFPLMFIRERAPSEAGVYDPREARVDFSGLALRTGFRIRF